MEKNFDKVLRVNLQDDDRAELLAKALSGKTRRDILRLLNNAPMTIWDIAKALDVPLSSVSEHISLLIKVGIVSVIRQSDRRGNSKIVARQYEKVEFCIVPEHMSTINRKSEIIAIPIGSYHSFKIHQYCGMVSTGGYIGDRDDPNTFYAPNRGEAGLLWLDYGYLEYVIPLKKDPALTLQSLSFTLELCSEAPGYNENWPSDIYFELNGVRVGCYTCPGDFGERNGIYTPKWWKAGTQYGITKKLEISDAGSFLDGQMLSSLSLSDLAPEHEPVIRFRIGVDENAKNRGGLNLFGKGFGDRGDHILLSVSYKEI